MVTSEISSAPGAVVTGRFGVAQALLARAETEMLHHGPDQSWLPDPSIKAAREFLSQYTKDKERNFGKVSQCTHYLETASWLHNCPETQHVERPVAAYVGYGHDSGEDYKKQGVTPELFVEETWLGPERLKPYLKKTLRQLTDKPELSGKARLNDQVLVAREKMGHLGNYARYADKYCSIYRDRWALVNGLHVFSNPADARRYFDYLERRANVVHRLRIEPEYMQEFDTLREQVQTIVLKQMGYKYGPSFTHCAQEVFKRTGVFVRHGQRQAAKLLSKASHFVF